MMIQSRYVLCVKLVDFAVIAVAAVMSGELPCVREICSWISPKRNRICHEADVCQDKTERGTLQLKGAFGD